MKFRRDENGCLSNVRCLRHDDMDISSNIVVMRTGMDDVEQCRSVVGHKVTPFPQNFLTPRGVISIEDNWPAPMLGWDSLMIKIPRCDNVAVVAARALCSAPLSQIVQPLFKVRHLMDVECQGKVAA